MNQGFPPLAGDNPRVLILGSLPGAPSLKAGEYYANKRNAFWSIMEELLGLDPELDYDARALALMNAGVALWDVLGAAERKGSLDSKIKVAKSEVNDFHAFLERYPTIQSIFLNGRKADELFRKRVLPGLERPDLTVITLPSTSPANSSMTKSDKLEAWGAIRNVLGLG